MPPIPTTPVLHGDEDARRAACEYGPLATRRKRMAAACRCAECTLGPWADRRVRKLLEVGRAYAERALPLPAVTAALREADRAAAEVGGWAAADVWSIFEGRRAGDAARAARATRTATSAVRWALGVGGAFPLVPSGWAWARAARAYSSTAPVCDPAWRTPDALVLSRLIQANETDVLPILADALQDAGCDDEAILAHCRDHTTHTSGCWVPDLILDTE